MQKLQDGDKIIVIRIDNDLYYTTYSICNKNIAYIIAYISFKKLDSSENNIVYINIDDTNPDKLKWHRVLEIFLKPAILQSDIIYIKEVINDLLFFIVSDEHILNILKNNMKGGLSNGRIYINDIIKALCISNLSIKYKKIGISWCNKNITENTFNDIKKFIFENKLEDLFDSINQITIWYRNGN